MNFNLEDHVLFIELAKELMKFPSVRENPTLVEELLKETQRHIEGLK